MLRTLFRVTGMEPDKHLSHKPRPIFQTTKIKTRLLDRDLASSRLATRTSRHKLARNTSDSPETNLRGTRSLPKINTKARIDPRDPQHKISSIHLEGSEVSEVSSKPGDKISEQTRAPSFTNYLISHFTSRKNSLTNQNLPRQSTQRFANFS